MTGTIYIVGARASGKQPSGHTLAKELGYSFVDTDIYMFETTRLTVADVVAKEG